MLSARVCAGLCVVQRRRSGVAGDAISCGAKSDEEVFGGCILLPACVRASGVSGRGLYLGSTAYGASVCRPGNAYAGFVSNTNVINYATPFASWGPNTCDSTGMTTLSQCGNLTGVGTQNTPAGFGNTIVHVTNVNTDGNPNTIWQTYDQPSINAWNIEGFCPRSLPQCRKDKNCAGHRDCRLGHRGL